MIKVNKSDGSTLSFDLHDEKACEQISSLLRDGASLEKITGIGCLHHTYWHQLTKPKKFKNIRFHVEKVKHKKNGVLLDIGEKIVCQADDIQLTILVYYNIRPKMTRIEIKKIGKQRFVPNREINDGTDKEDNK